MTKTAPPPRPAPRNGTDRSPARPTAPPAPPAHPAGRALVVAADAGRPQALATLQDLGYAAEATADPYAAVARLAADRGSFSNLVLSLAAVLPEELGVIETVKARLGPIDVTVCDVDGRGAEFGEAMRLGADALLAGGDLHRMTPPTLPPSPLPNASAPARDWPDESADRPAAGNGDPALTPAELRALLDD